MLNKQGTRELAYVVTIEAIELIPNADRVELATVGGWKVMVKKDQFKVGDLAIYFEIDSKVPAVEPFMFLEPKGFKIKTQKYFKGTVISQGLLMSGEDFGWETVHDGAIPRFKVRTDMYLGKGDFVTELLGVTYAEDEDNKRKAPSTDKYKQMAQRKLKIFKQPWAKWLMKREWGRKVMFALFGRKKDKKNGWPVGKFPGVSKTDQERVENMTWILQDKTPLIKTQKCDGSSGTYILEKKKFGYEFYVCSRNVRMANEDQPCFYDTNCYWEVAKKYDIKNKMKDFLKTHPYLTFVCWQGEICSPSIQKNPHHLTETHFYCFHMTDSCKGRYDIRVAKEIWDSYGMETVPIIDENYILPDDFETLKADADGFYDPSVCEGNENCPREGFVYYKTTEPSFSFKNVSRNYLLKHNEQN